MAAYFIQYSYCSWSAKDIRYKDTCIIDFERFEKVDSESFYRKFHNEVTKQHERDCYPIIQNVVKL